MVDKSLSWLQFETNTYCGGHCTFCPHSHMERSGAMEWDTLMRVINDYVPRASTVHPFLYQDPVLEHRLPEILKLIKAANPTCTTSIYTPLSQWGIMTEVLDSRAIDDIYISFYGSKEHYEKFQAPYRYERTACNLACLITAPKIGGRPRLHVQYPALKELMGDFESYKARWGKFLASIDIVNFDTKLSGPGFEQADVFAKCTHERNPCDRLSNGMTILFNGDVVPCCIDYSGSTVVGNVNTQTFDEIWHGEKLNKLREGQANGKYEGLCEDCLVWQWR